MGKRLTRKFYTRKALVVARQLLGKYIVHKTSRGKLIGRIVETEAYVGPKDKASHAYLGKKTLRNAAEFLIGGHIYIYLVYGMHWQFNISASKSGVPECVLIRAVEPIIAKTKINSSAGGENFKKIANGPGKLCRYLKLDKSLYGEDLVKSKKIWLEDCAEGRVQRAAGSGPRIGIDYAGPVWAAKPWRFWIKGDKFVSGAKY